MPTRDLAEFLRLVYDDYRDMRLNEIYYGRRLHRVLRLNVWTDIVIAVGTSAVVASWAIWRVEAWGSAVWGIGSALAAVLALVRPFLRLGERIEGYTRLAAGYRALFLEVEGLIAAARLELRVSDEMVAAMERIRSQRRAFTGEDADPDDKLRVSAQAAVEAEIPAAGLWMPPAEVA